MQVDIIRAQHAHLREALAALLAPAAERAARAAAEVERAFRDGVPVWAQPEVGTIRAILSGPGGPRDARASVAALPDPQLARLSIACLDLYTVACREYWTA